jgi:hypothetical protein
MAGITPTSKPRIPLNRQKISDVISGGSGDMTKAIYDPTSVTGDTFDMDNMVEGTDTKILTSAERALIASALQSETSHADVLVDGDIGVTVAAALGTDDNYVTDAEKSALHTQNTDTGTTGNTFTVDSDSTTGKIIVDVALGAADLSLTLTNEALTSTSKTITFPNASGTVSFLALGETSATAYRGDRGKTAYDHSQATHAPADAINKTTADGYYEPVYTEIEITDASGAGAPYGNSIIYINIPTLEDPPSAITFTFTADPDDTDRAKCIIKVIGINTGATQVLDFGDKLDVTGANIELTDADNGSAFTFTYFRGYWRTIF